MFKVSLSALCSHSVNILQTKLAMQLNVRQRRVMLIAIPVILALGILAICYYHFKNQYQNLEKINLLT